MNNPFSRQLPVKVMLRNRLYATVEQLVVDRPPFHLLGRMGVSDIPGHHVAEEIRKVPSENGHHLWRTDGRWLEDGKTHPLDIVGEVTAIDQDGVTVMTFSGAAGAKGPL